MDKIRKQLETCDQPEGVIFHHSQGGGTGSSAPVGIAKRLKINYGKLNIISNMIMGSNNCAESSNIVEPYNVCCAFEDIVEYIDLIITNTNSALANICKY